MNKNKGIIGIGLILAIVLGIVVVGGGAYYLGKSSSKSDVNNLVVNQKQEVPVIDNNQPVKVTSECTPSSAPSITVLSPNGGETYNSGENIDVKWTSCNIVDSKKQTYTYVSIHNSNDGGSPYNNVFGPTEAGKVKLSDGATKAFLPSDIISGQHYYARVDFYDNSKNPAVKITDDSDKLFTIIKTNSCTSDKGNVMTYDKALAISKASSCNSVGEFTGEIGCNPNGGGLIDVYMKPTDKPNCAFACRVSIDTGKAEEGWMCTGAAKPVDDNEIRFANCGVSISKTSDWSVISNTSNETVLDIPSTDHIIGTSGINIKCVLGNSITDTDAKFGNITYYYDSITQKWMVNAPDERDGGTLPAVVATPLFTVNGWPVFRGTSRWLSYIIPISPSSILYFHEGDTEGGYTQTLTNLVKTLKKL